MEATTPMKAIRLKCLDCCGGSFSEVRECTVKRCPLYRYRSGHNPACKRKKNNGLEAEL